MGRAATGTQWMTGGVGMAEWSGVPLLEVLDRAGIRQTAVDVLLIGLDVESAERGFRKAISIDEGEGRDRSVEDPGQELDLIVEDGLVGAIEQPGLLKSEEPVLLGKVL